MNAPRNSLTYKQSLLSLLLLLILCSESCLWYECIDKRKIEYPRQCLAFVVMRDVVLYLCGMHFHTKQQNKCDTNVATLCCADCTMYMYIHIHADVH